MSFKLIPPKLAKKDVLILYNITHPTLRTWFRRAGLAEFVGRRKFEAHELVLIFQAIGKPRLARTAAQHLKDVYARLKGLLPDEVRFKDKYKRELPPQRQDQLPDSEEELDAASAMDLEKRSTQDPVHIHDAISRLRITAILLLGQRGRKLQASQASVCELGRGSVRKSLAKRRRMRR